MNPFVLGVIGDSGSGKNTLANAITFLLGPERVTDLRLDDYHRFTREERATRGVTALNPMVHNTTLIQEHLQLLRGGRPIRNRTYEHANGTFGPIRLIEPQEFVVVRGLLGYPTDELRSLYHLAVFLHPEPELLFRWKLRRDVQSRGYTEAEVLKYIAHHLLDSKQFVLPQAERADLVVRHQLTDWEAPDSEIHTSLILRRAMADLARREDLFRGLAVEIDDRGEEVTVDMPQELEEGAVNAWGLAHFPESYVPSQVGMYTNEHGELERRAQLAMVEVLVARATTLLRAQG